MRRVDAAVKSPILNLNIHFVTTVHASNPHYDGNDGGRTERRVVFKELCVRGI